MIPIKVSPTGHEGEVYEAFFKPNVCFSGTLMAQTMARCKVCEDPCYPGAIPVETRYYPEPGRLVLTGPNADKSTCNIKLHDHTIEVDQEFILNPDGENTPKIWKEEEEK